MKQHTFPLSDTGKEFPARFGKQEITYDYPETLAEMEKLLPPTPEGKTFEQWRDEVFAHNINGQGLHLTKQKAAKDVLGEEEGEPKNRRYKYATAGELTEILALATKAAQEATLQAPGTKRGEGKATKLAKTEQRAVQAEAKVESQTQAIKDMYLKLPKNARALYATDLVERGVLTQAEIDELNKQGA